MTPTRDPLRPLSQPSQISSVNLGSDKFGLSEDDGAALLEAETAFKRKLVTPPERPRKAPRLYNEDQVTAVARQAVRQRFSLPGFRLKQEQAISRLLNGEGAVVVFPTGLL